MLNLEGRRIYLKLGDTDMRKGIRTLALVVERDEVGELFSGSLFLFSNRKKTQVKLLYWDENGFALWQKQLEKEKFKWPKGKGKVWEIEAKSLRWLLAGLNIEQAHQRLSYRTLW